MKRVTWGTLALGCLFSALALLAGSGGSVSAQADDDELKMQVTVGFDGYCRSGGWCPVYVVLSNEGVGVEGELRAGGDADSSLYARRVVLPAHSRKAYFLYLPLDRIASRSRLGVRLLAGDEVLLSEQVAVAWLEAGDRLYGVVSSRPSALNFLSDVAPVGGEASVAHLVLESLPPDPVGWEGLDVLILNDVDTAGLIGEQRRALETWLAHGGHLVVGGGTGAARTVVGVADLVPVAVEGTQSVRDLEALGNWLGAPVSTGPYALADAVLRDGEELVRQGDSMLLAHRAYGAGGVDFLAFDAGLKPFTRWDDNIRLWESIVGTEAEISRRLAVHNGYAAREAVGAIPGFEFPSVLQILAFMLVYVLLIGPVNYLLLRKFGRRELAWLTIPVLVVGFSACAYVTGFQLRGAKAIVHRLAAVYVPRGTRTGRVSEVVGLFSPRRTNYDLRIVDGEVREIPDPYHGGPSGQPLHITTDAEGVRVVDLRVDVGGIHPFVVEGYADVSGVEADLELIEDAAGRLWLEGVVRNDGVLLNEAVLIAGDDAQRLGDLEPGGEVTVRLGLHDGGGTSKPWSSVSPYGHELVEQILGPGEYWNDRGLYRRYQFLQAILTEEGVRSGMPRLSLGSGVRLVGWAEEGVPLPVEVVERPFSTVAAAFCVYDLPVEEIELGSTVTVPSGLITRQVEGTVGGWRCGPRVFTWNLGLRLCFDSPRGRR